MKCEICGKRDAVLFVQQVTATKTTEMHICFECAKMRGISPAGENMEVSLSNLLSGLLQGREKMRQNEACPVCGCTLANLKSKRSAGCPECYTVFKSHVFSLLKEAGFEGTYQGKLPKKIAHFRSVLTDRMIFQSKMSEAIAVEDYEKAAVYRDRLRALESRAVSDCGDDYE